MNVFDLLDSEEATPTPTFVLPSIPKYKHLVGFDTETHLISAANPIPPMVCITFAYNHKEYDLFGGTVEGKVEGIKHFSNLVDDPGTCLVGLNVYFDLQVVVSAARELIGEDYAISLHHSIYEKMERGLIRELSIIAKGVAIRNNWMHFDPTSGGRPKFSLAAITQRVLGVTMTGKNGDDVWRMRYHELDGVNTQLWPSEASEYAIMDSVYTQAAYERMAYQYGHQPDEIFQTLKGFALSRASVWGMLTEESKIDELEAKLRPRVEATKAILLNGGELNPGDDLWDESWDDVAPVAITSGIYKTNKAAINRDLIFGYAEGLIDKRQLMWMRTASGKLSFAKNAIPELARKDPVIAAFVNKDYPALIRMGLAKLGKLSRNTKLIKNLTLAWYESENLTLGVDWERTAGGGIKTDRETLLFTDNRSLHLLASIGASETILNTFIPAFRRGTEYPVHPFWNALVTSGRVSVSHPNLNNVPRQGGVRECFRARPGYVLCSSDYQQAELGSLAQLCLDKFGFSRMAEAIIEGKDLHLVVAAQIMKIDYSEVVSRYASNDKEAANARQLAKVANFGFPGGQGIKSFQKFAKKAGVKLSYAEVEELKAIWLATYPEVSLYFKWVNNQLAGRDHFDYIQHRTNRVRGGVGYCDGCNTGFQGLTADGAGNAMILINYECYYDESSPLYGSRICAFIYDEFLVEIPEGNTQEAVKRLEELMVIGMQQLTPDVPARTDPALMYNWSKSAKAVYDESGNMIAWNGGQE